MRLGLEVQKGFHVLRLNPGQRCPYLVISYSYQGLLVTVGEPLLPVRSLQTLLWEELFIEMVKGEMGWKGDLEV